MGLLDQFLAYYEANTPRNTRPAVSPLKVIDQGLLGSRIEQMPQRAEEIKQGLLRVPADLKQLGGPEMNQMVQGAYANPSPEGFDREKGMQMAMDFLQTSTPVGGLAGIFIGKGAKTWDALAAQQADDLLKQGIDPREVWKQTGTLKGVDGAWRQEIPDNAAKYKGQMPSWNSLGKELPVSESFKHDDLYSAYPETANIKLVGNDATSSSVGSFDGEANKIYVDAQLNPKHQKKIGSTTLHELQHAIQQREGWARGGGPDELAKRYQSAQDEYDLMFQTMKANPERADEIRPILDSLRNEYRDLANPNEAYRRLAGEAEARLTQSRMGLDAAQRLQHYPYDQGPYGLDVPLDSLIVRGLLNQ